MSEKAIKSGEGYTEDAEFRFIGSLFASLMASAGLLAGTMIRERSLEYWSEDIMSLLLLAFAVRGLVKSSLELVKDSMYYEEQKKYVEDALRKQQEMLSEMGDTANGAETHQISSKMKYSEEEVLDAVSKRIQQNKEEAVRKSKLVN